MSEGLTALRALIAWPNLRKYTNIGYARRAHTPVRPYCMTKSHKIYKYWVCKKGSHPCEPFLYDQISQSLQMLGKPEGLTALWALIALPNLTKYTNVGYDRRAHRQVSPSCMTKSHKRYKCWVWQKGSQPCEPLQLCYISALCVYIANYLWGFPWCFRLFLDNVVFGLMCLVSHFGMIFGLLSPVFLHIFVIYIPLVCCFISCWISWLCF